MNTRTLFAFCFSLLAGSYTLKSCCKAICTDDGIFIVDFIGFSAAEMEIIKVLRYNQGDFNTVLDSFYVSSNNIYIRDTTRVNPDKPFLSDFDYRIVVEKASSTTTISGIQTKKENCSCGPGTYKTITGFKLNGFQYPTNSRGVLEIIK